MHCHAGDRSGASCCTWKVTDLVREQVEKAISKEMGQPASKDACVSHFEHRLQSNECLIRWVAAVYTEASATQTRFALAEGAFQSGVV